MSKVDLLNSQRVCKTDCNATGIDSQQDEIEASDRHHRRIWDSLKSYKYTPLLYDDEGQIRQTRLLVLLPGNFRDELRITLHAIPFPNPGTKTVAPLYEALSYVWGDLEPRSQITVDTDSQSYSLDVTQNLFEVLVYLRHEKLPRIMWIDAICINQSDLIERAQQVERMRDIYANATHTVAWLGANSEPRLNERDLGIFELIQARVKYDEITEGFTLNHYCDVHTYDHLAHEIVQLQNWHETVLNITSRPYFSRLWIRQEFVLSKKLTMQVGLICISGSSVRLALRYLSVGLVEKPVTLKPAIEDFTRMPETRRIGFLPHLMHYGTNSSCRDPRDRVWAFLGLLTPEVAKVLNIIPDYSKPVREVYIDAAIKCIKANKDTHIIHFCKLREKSSDEYSLPSWVPDWTDPEIPEQMPPRRACAFGFAPNDSDIDGEILYVEWLPLCRIRGCYRYDLPQQSGALEFANYIRRLYTEVRRDFPPEMYSIEQLYGIIMVGNLRKFVHHRSPVIESATGENILIPAFKQLLQAPNEEVATLVNKNASVTLHRKMASILLSRRIFATSRGELGIGPKAVCEGDQLGICTSDTYPLILRELGRDQKYQVVGSCYLDGVMWGEALLGEFDAHIEPAIKRLEAGSLLLFRNKNNGKTQSLDPRVPQILGNEWEEFDPSKWQGPPEEWYRNQIRRACEKRNVKFERIKLV